MLKDIKLMIEFVKELSSIEYGKEVFFYDYKEDKWYSRDHSRYVEFEEIIEWLKDRIYPSISEEVIHISSECIECKRYIDDECYGDIHSCLDLEK